MAVRTVFKLTTVPTAAHRLRLTGSKPGPGVRLTVRGVVAVQPPTPVLITEKLLTPADRLTDKGLAIWPVKPANTLVKPSKALLLWLAVKIALRLTGVPTAAHKLKLTGNRAGTAVRLTVNGVVAVHPPTPVLNTEKLLTPADKLTAKGLATVPVKPANTFVSPKSALLL